ncbi:MAG: N-acetylmuramoyl-L-alanine amidase [Anaerolineaceae bacterium]
MNTTEPIPSNEEQPVEQTTRKPAVTSFRIVWSIASAAVLVATLFTLWTPASFFSNNLAEKFALAFQSNPESAAGTSPTPTGRPQQTIGIVAGHYGNDSGAVCDDGTKEVDVNLRIAELVRSDLMEQGYNVEVLQEFDDRLTNFQGLVLISIHNDSCQYVNDEATGFKVAAALGSSNSPDKATRLTSCMVDRYKSTTNLPYHPGSTTNDMSRYHAFDEINPGTVAAIIETGFLNLDKDILVNHPDVIANGVTAGILCYIRNESIQPTPVPTAAP